MRKGKDPGPGGPKTCGSGSGSAWIRLVKDFSLCLFLSGPSVVHQQVAAVPDEGPEDDDGRGR
jgi:hypothetical protein